ncbi:hypothetical protein VNO77_17874 [Canavalia gladiata]|uniref:Uncharacterized protein n=1 Tax=Canavalia gladiata TaxID=3824 RepID=A0AAN9QN41_CANGL
MAELPSSLLSFIPINKDKGAEQRMFNPNSLPQGFIPIPATRYKSYGTESYFVEFEPYDCGYQCVRPPQFQVNKNEFMSNKTTVDAVQAQISVFSLVRRGTGVFHPSCPRPRTVHNRKFYNNRGRTNEEGTEVTHHGQRSRNASKVNNGFVNKEECLEETPSDIGLPKEWTY